MNRRGGQDGAAATTLVLLLVAVTGTGLYWTPKPTTRQYLAATAERLTRQLGEGPRAAGLSRLQPVVASQGDTLFDPVVRDIETITGSIDGHELVGRRVDLHVPVLARVGKVGFWVGPRDNRVLVVTTRALAEGSRTGGRRRAAQSGASEPAAVPIGDKVAVKGTIKRVADELPQWNVTPQDRAELVDLTIYIRAD